MEAGEDGQTSFGGLRASYLCALHAHKSEDGTEETQTHSGDHQTPTHLDIGFMTEIEICDHRVPDVCILSHK